MFGYNGTAECCCDEKNTCAVILLDCPSSDRPVDHIKNQFYGRFDTTNEEWNETCDKLWYTDSAVIFVDTSAIEYIDDNVGVNSFTYDIRKDTDGIIRRFRPGEWVTEINEFSVGSHTIQYIHKEKFCYPWECNLVKYPDSIESLKTRYNSVDESTLIDSDGNELEHPNIGIHCLNEVIVDGRVVFKAGTWDDIAEGCYNECKSKFLRLYENTSTEGDDEQPVNSNYENIRPNKYTNYLIRRDKWIYVYWGNILATRFYDDCTDEYINLTFSVECGGSVDYTRRIEVTPCSFQWWKPDKWWLLKEYLPYLPMDATEEQVQKRMDELIISKEEKTGCPYPECCRYISNELKEYSESIVAKINGLPTYTYYYIDPSRKKYGNEGCKETAVINLGELNRYHKFKYSLCCGYQMQDLVKTAIGNSTVNCIAGSSCSGYYTLYPVTNTYELLGNVYNFKWEVNSGIIACPVCLEAWYGTILNISFRNFSNYAGVEISIKPPYGYATINKYGDVEFQMPTSLPFGVNVIRFEYTLYDIYGTTSRSTISVKLAKPPLTCDLDVLSMGKNKKNQSYNLGTITANYIEQDYSYPFKQTDEYGNYIDPEYTITSRKNIHSNVVKGNLDTNYWGDVYANNVESGEHLGLEITELTIKDQFNNECKTNLISIVSDSNIANDTEDNKENIITEQPNGISPAEPPAHEDYDDEFRFKKGERTETKDGSIKVFPLAPYYIYTYSGNYDNLIGPIKLASVVVSPGTKGSLRASASIYSSSNVLAYTEDGYVYAYFKTDAIGELKYSVSVNGATTRGSINLINNYTEEEYKPIEIEPQYEDDNEAYDFGLVNKVSFTVNLQSYYESDPSYWNITDSSSISFTLYWIVQKQILDLEDIVSAKFVHVPTISTPRYITKHALAFENDVPLIGAAHGDGIHYSYWEEKDEYGFIITPIKRHSYKDSDSNIVGRTEFFFGSNISYDQLKLDEVTVSFGVGNDLIDCFNHDEQPFNGRVIFIVSEEHYREDFKYVLDSNGNIQRDNSGNNLTEITRTLDEQTSYTIELEPHTHNYYIQDDSAIENNASCDCPRGIQSYWFTEYKLCSSSLNDKYAILKQDDDCTDFPYAQNNYYNYWEHISFEYKDNQAYISDGYHTYGKRQEEFNDEKCGVIPADNSVWLEITVGADVDTKEYPVYGRNYITRYTVKKILKNG